jgi:transposase
MENGTFAYKRNYNKMDGAARNNGFFCLLTDTNLSSADTLDVYRRKDVIEKGFDDIKNHLDMKRMHTHRTATTDGKMFCAFIALIAVSEMTNKLRGFMRDKRMSKDDLIYELEKIKVIIMADGKRLMNPLTKTQRTIIEACGLNNADLLAYVS